MIVVAKLCLRLPLRFPYRVSGPRANGIVLRHSGDLLQVIFAALGLILTIGFLGVIECLQDSQRKSCIMIWTWAFSCRWLPYPLDSPLDNRGRSSDAQACEVVTSASGYSTPDTPAQDKEDNDTYEERQHADRYPPLWFVK
jgi:hypothetical protein